MADGFFAEQLFGNGLADLLSVIPPGAALAPLSKIPLAAIGKVPGRKNSLGLWGGYDWRKHQATLDDVKRWVQDGANIGLRADRFPGVDIDCTDEPLAGIIQQVALAKLGSAPVRIGRWPKRLLMYRTSAPFGRMRMLIYAGRDKHLVEILGAGQQYVVSGIHPATKQPYSWSSGTLLRADALTEISREQCNHFFDELEATLGLLDYVVERVGDGSGSSETPAVNQEELRAPSLEALERVVQVIPNDQWDYDRYVKIGYAIKAAAGDDEEGGYAVFAEWASRWTEKAYDADVTRSDWRRFKGPFKVGFSWLCELARGFGFQDAVDVFEAVADAPVADNEARSIAPEFSDQGLADRIIDARGGELRFVPETGRTYVWSGYVWEEDKTRKAETVVDQELCKLADQLLRASGTAEGEQKRNQTLAVALCSTQKAQSVMVKVRRNPTIALGANKLDADPWLLNTPAGLIDLKTGKLLGPNPDALCARSTSVAPDFTADCPRWKEFLFYASGDNQPLVDYLQRLCGYALTGSTREQQLTFIWGGGGNGKGVFIETLRTIFGSYHKTSAMDVFTARNQEQHPTELADLVGARLVTAQETEQGKRWNESRIKSLTGGDEIKARYMREDFFTYKPQFKLLFVGNDRPALRSVDEAMRRRMQLVTFPVQVPEERKNENFFSEVLAPELPAILAWMIEGCLMWQEQKLMPPEVVTKATTEYLEDEDEFGMWLQECCEKRPEAFTPTAELFRSWEQWANAANAYVGHEKTVAGALQKRGFRRVRDSNRRRGFRGIALIQRQDIGVIS